MHKLVTMSMTLQGTRWYSIREAAQLTGLAESTLRYYESVKVLPPAHRDESSGHRIYSELDIDALLTVSCLNATGMPLGDMREYLQANRTGAPLPSAQIALLQGQQARLRDQARMLKMKQKYLALKVRYWQTRETGDDEEARGIAREAAELVQKLHGIER